MDEREESADEADEARDEGAKGKGRGEARRRMIWISQLPGWMSTATHKKTPAPLLVQGF